MEHQSVEQQLLEKVRAKNVRAVRAIIEMQGVLTVDINALVHGEPLLHAAVYTQSLEMVACFFAHPDINPNVLDLGCNSPLMVAVDRGSKKICKLLINKGAILIGIRNHQGEDALDIAIRKTLESPLKSRTDILKLLLKNGAAFCRDLPVLKSLSRLMNDYVDCYFFETAIEGKKITKDTPGFQNAYIIEIEKASADSVGMPQKNLPPWELEARTDELLRENPDLVNVRKLKRCYLFSKTIPYAHPSTQIIEQRPLITLKSIVAQHFRERLQENETRAIEEVRSLTKDIYEFIVRPNENDLTKQEIEVCLARIAELTRLLNISYRRNIGKPLAMCGFIVLMLIAMVICFEIFDTQCYVKCLTSDGIEVAYRNCVNNTNSFNVTFHVVPKPSFCLGLIDFVTIGAYLLLPLLLVAIAMGIVFNPFFPKTPKIFCINALTHSLKRFFRQVSEENVQGIGLASDAPLQEGNVTSLGEAQEYLEELRKYHRDVLARPIMINTRDNFFIRARLDLDMEAGMGNERDEVGRDDVHLIPLEMQPMH